MRLSLKILESNSQIQKMILEAIIDEADSYMRRGISIIKKELPSIISNIIYATPEYISLVGGKLKLELGIPDANQKVAQLINSWINNVVYNYSQPRISAGKIRTEFSAQLIQANFEDVLGGEFAFVNDGLRGYSLPWLEWLLLEGNRVLVPKHRVIIGPSKYSRTGYAVMRESKDNWRIPSEFAGTFTDNWITRAIDKAQPDIESLLNKAFQ